MHINPGADKPSLRIGFDAKRLFNNRTGLGNYSRFVVSGMLENFPQHEYFLFTPGISPEFGHLYAGYENVHVITPQSAAGRLFRSWWRSRGITRHCRELGLDVYHGLSNELPANIRSFSGKKIVTIHDLIFMRYPSYYRSIDRRIYGHKFRQACRDADVIVAASRQTAGDIGEFFGSTGGRVQVVYQDCDAQFGRPFTAAELEAVRSRYDLPGSFIVCVGTIEERKKQLTVLEAWHRSGLDVALVFVGRQTDYAEKLHRFVRENNLGEKVRFLSNASFSDFPAFYRLAKLAVYASEFEGFGIPVLEALRSGANILVARTSSLTEVGGDVVTYFDEKNSEELAGLMKQALNSPLRTQQVEAHLARFDKKALIFQLHALYTST